MVAVGAAASGCGGDDASSAGLASLTPPDAPVFVDGTIRPEGDQRDAIDSFAERIAGIDDIGSLITPQVDALFSSNGVDADYADDVEPWLGDEGAVFVSSFPKDGEVMAPDFAAMIAVDDADQARDFLGNVLDQDAATEEERSYEGTQYSFTDPYAIGVVDDTALVLGTETAFKVAVDASQGESLAASAEYTDRIDALPDDPLATLYFEPAAAIEALAASQDIGPAEAQIAAPLLGGPLSQPVAATVTADADSAAVDIAAEDDSGDELGSGSALLTDLPAGSWFAAALPGLGSRLERIVDQLSSSGLPGAGMIERQVQRELGIDLSGDVFSWLGDAAAFVEGTGVPGFSAGLIAQTSDPQGPRALLDALQRLAEQRSGLPSSGPPQGADYGFSIGLPGVGGGAEAGVIGDELVAVIGATADQALNPDQTLGDDQAFEDALTTLGDDLAPLLYLDLPSFFQVAEQGSDGDLDYDAIRPYIDAFSTLIVGGQVTDGLMHSRVSVELAPR